MRKSKLSNDPAQWATGDGWTAPEAQFRGRPFRLTRPDPLASAVVFSSPHSGRAYFTEFVRTSRLRLPRLRASEDAFVDELFDAAPACGAPLLAAVAPRAFVDVNRCAGDLDPALLDPGALGRQTAPPNARVAAGLGVVPRIVAEGEPIYATRLPLAEVERRVSAWHAPYHVALAHELWRARRRFGWCLLLDCHSMPSASAALAPRDGAPDVILGDRFGVSASPALVNAIEAIFQREGFVVSRNAPFAGGYITERYGRPSADVHAIQIELSRGLYLDEARVARGPRFLEIKQRIDRVAAAIADLGRARASTSACPSGDVAEAAE